MTNIDETMVQDLVDADRAFIGAVRKALADFDAAPPADLQQWPTWRRPDPWRDTVLPNVERYLQGAEDGLREFKAGKPKRAFLAAQGQMGITKKVEFDLGWTTPAHQQAINDAMTRISEVADRTWRIGYAEGLAKP